MLPIERAEFEKHLPAFGVRWPLVARGLSYGVPVAELLIGLLLITGIFVDVATTAAAALLGVFTLVVAAALVRRTPVSCGCFGNIGEGKITLFTLARNGILLFFTWVLGVGYGVVPVPLVPSVTLGTALALSILIIAKYLHVLPNFLDLPASPKASGIRWSYVDPSVRYWKGWLTRRYRKGKRWV